MIMHTDSQERYKKAARLDVPDASQPETHMPHANLRKKRLQKPTGAINEPTTTRSGREVKPTTRYTNLLTVELLEYTICQVANLTVAEAKRRHPKLAVEALMGELKQMVEHRVWRYLNTTDWDREQLRQVIPSKIFLKEKINASGEFEKLKARLVAGGHRQENNGAVDTYAPTSDCATIFATLNVAINRRRHIRLIDIKAAYLNAILRGKPIHMRLSKDVVEELIKVDPTCKEFVRADGSMIVLLTKALYGLIESAALWNKVIHGVLIEHGFVCHESVDKCLYTMPKGGKNSNGTHLTLTVDDLLLTAETVKELDEVEAMLSSKYEIVTHRVTDIDAIVSHLGLRVEYRRTKGWVKISQPHYTEQLVTDNNITATRSTPMNRGAIKHEGYKSPAFDKHLYRSEVYRTLYLATRTRPDILFACAMLATRTENPRQCDWDAYQHLLMYLNGTRLLGLVFREGKMTVSGYIDAAYIVHDDCKSHTGACIHSTEGSGSILSKSTKQKVTADSSCAAEIIGLNTYARHVAWYGRLLRALGESIDEAVVYQDNESTIHLATNGPTQRGKSKWMDVRYFAVKELVEQKVIKLRFVRSEDNIADILTKPLAGQLFLRLRELLLGREPQD